MDPTMGIAPRILAVVTLGVLVLLAGSALSQVSFAPAMGGRDAARGHEQHRPQWRGIVETTDTAAEDRHRLVLELISPGIVDTVRGISVDISRMWFTDDQHGREWNGYDACLAHNVRAGHRGDAAWSVTIPDPAPAIAIARLQVTSTIGPETWVTTLDIPIPT